MTVRKAIIILILGISVFSNAEAGQITLDSAASYGKASMTLVTPQEMAQAADSNFGELYGFWATIDTEAEFKELYNLEAGVDFYSVSAIDTMLGDYVLTSALTTALGDYVLTSALTTALGDYVLTSALATATVKKATELAPVKESGVAGMVSVQEANGTDTSSYGIMGPDSISTTVVEKWDGVNPTNGQVKIYGTPLISQTLPNDETGTILPFSFGDMAGGGAPTFQTTDPSVTDTSGLYINTTDGDMFAVNQNTGISTWATTYTPWWLLTAQDPGNSNVISSDGTIDCGDGATDCTQYLSNTSTPTLMATAASGYEFLAWTGDATDTSTTTNPDTITMDAAKTVGATFNLLPTLDSGAVMSVSNQIVIPFTEALTIGSGGSGGIVVTGSVTGASNGTYLSGDTTAEFTFLTADDFQSGETITVAYTQPTDGLEDSDGGDLASFSGESVTNSIEGSITPAFHIEFDADSNWADGYTMGGADISAGDTTGTVSNLAIDTTNYVSGSQAAISAASYGYMRFDLPTGFSFDKGQYSESRYFPITVTDQYLFQAQYDADNRIYFRVESSKLVVSFVGSGTTISYQYSTTITADTFHTIDVRWDSSGAFSGGARVAVQVDAGGWQYEADGDTWTTWVSPAPDIELVNYSSNYGSTVDNISIYCAQYEAIE